MMFTPGKEFEPEKNSLPRLFRHLMSVTGRGGGQKFPSARTSGIRSRRPSSRWFFPGPAEVICTAYSVPAVVGARA